MNKQSTKTDLNLEAIKDIMKKLAEKRPIFHSEADFQHELAIIIKDYFNNAKIRLEKPYILSCGKNMKKIKLDMEIRINDKKYAIELKYKTKSFEYELDDDKFNLTNQAAQNDGSYLFAKDTIRIQKLIKQHNFNNGFAIFLTNDKGYYGNLHKNNEYSHSKKDNDNIEIAEYKNKFEWVEYKDFNEGQKNAIFKYLILAY